MRRLLLFFLLFSPAFSQTQLDLSKQTRNMDFSQFPFTKPIKSGTDLPETCIPGEYFFKSDATAGENTYACTSEDEWTLQSGGGGGGGGAPTNATYITQTSNGSLSAEQALAALDTGILKNTTITGVLSIATGADLPSHNHAASDVNSGAFTLAGARFANNGTTTTVLIGNASGNPSFGAVNLTSMISGILPGANGGTANGFFAVSGPASSLKTFTFPNADATVLTTNALVTGAQGGTGNGFFAVSGPASSLKTFTFPNADATVLTSNAAVTVVQGGTGLTSGTSGGVPYYSGTTALSSSGALTANLPVIGGGAGAAPTVGTRSGNTTEFATVTGSKTEGKQLAFDEDGNIIASASDIGGEGGGGAPTDATYITQTPSSGLSAEQALSALATGLVKNTTSTGVLSIAVAGTDYAEPAHQATHQDGGDHELNVQGLSGVLADPQTPASHVHSAADVTSGILAGARGGTNNGFMDFTGPASSPKTFTLPNASATILTSNAAVTVAQGGTGVATLTGILQGNGTSAITAITNSSTVGQVFRVTGTSTYAWGALDLADSDAVTGILPQSNGGTGASSLTAGIVESTPAGDVEAVTVDDAIAELATEKLPISAGALVEATDDYTSGSGTSAEVNRCVNTTDVNPTCIKYKPNEIVIPHQVTIAGPLIIGGVGSNGTITGRIDSRYIPFHNQWDEDKPNLMNLRGRTHWVILEIGCKVTGGGSSTVTATLTRNGNPITTEPMVCGETRETSCASSYGTCDVDTIDTDESTLALDDELGYDYDSDANSPETLSFSVVYREIPIP